MEEAEIDAAATDDKIDLAAALATFDEPFRPRTLGTLDDYKPMVAKMRGEFVWRTRRPTTSSSCSQAPDDPATRPGRRAGPRRAVRRAARRRACPRSDDGAEILPIEAIGTVNTGDAPPGEVTAPEQAL